MAYPTPVSSFPQTHSEIEMENEHCSPPATAFDSSFASASSSSSTTPADPMVYDVFINHRGPDTKTTFALHLYRRLLSHGFRAFLDQHELEGGFNFPSQIVSALRTASVHVAVFSPTYAESPWCLNELVLMVESKKPIIPVFYKVMPTKLRYGEALLKLETKTRYDPQTDSTWPRYDSATIQNWRNALSRVADISGFDLAAFNSDEIHLLDKVVECVLKRVKKKELYVAKYPTGLKEKVEDFETTVLKQQQHSGKVKVVGIVGLGGLGKTTLALELFNRKSSNYNKSYFLADVREDAKSSSLHLLQSKVLRGLTHGLTQPELDIDNIFEGTAKLKKYLQSSRVLLILDDIDHEDQLDAFLPMQDVLLPESLILITSRHIDVLRRSGVQESSIYKLTGLSTQHSQELFCSYAFCQTYPLQGFEDLVNKFLMTCQGLPLSLKVFGALLLGKNDRSFWEDKLCQVHEVPNDIQKRLTVSFHSLPEKEQQIFLDIACFFIGQNKDIAVRIWDDAGWKGSSGFQNLESKCLVEVDSDNCIHMHDQLRDIGREIALDKLPRRLCHPTETIDVLRLSSGLTEVRGIRKVLKKDSDIHHETTRSHELFQRSEWLLGNSVMKLHNRLRNLRYHIFGNGIIKLQLLESEGHLLQRILRRVHSPNLIWLSWRDCPYSYLPTWIPMKNLRVLKVEGKVLETLWQGRSQAPSQLLELEISGNLNLLKISKSIGQLKHLERIFFRCVSLQKLPEEFCRMRSLKALVLKGCSELEALPDSFGNLTNLQHMDLSWSESLLTLPESFGDLTNLQHMELSSCASLRRLPESFGNLTNLEHMKLNGCVSLKRLPESFGSLRNLQSMELSSCASLKSLPESFGNLTNLQGMELSGCGCLERLPESFGNLTNLQGMELSGCGCLERLPESFGNLTNLQGMELSGCGCLERLPESFGNLTNLQHMELSGCESLERLPESLGNLTNLQHMELSRCARLERLPESFGNLTNLQHMELSRCAKLERLPESFGNLRNLRHMELSRCTRLERLPESFGNLRNLQRMEVSSCVRLENLPESFRNLMNLQHMELSSCVMLKRLPKSFDNLTNLQHIELAWCYNLERLPESFGNLMNLQRMRLSGCESLERLPESFGNLTKLQRMELCGCQSLERLPESFANLTNLQLMELFGCGRLERLPESFGNLTKLQSMELSGCQSLKRLPESFGNLTNLQLLELFGCGRLERLPEFFGNLTKLRSMELSGCLMLEKLPESFGDLTNLQRMKLSGCESLERLPESFGNLTNLQRMKLSGCKGLRRLPKSFCNLRKLQRMKLYGCKSLESLPESFGNLTNLQLMELFGCGRLERLPDSLGNLKNLQRMELSGCERLKRLPESFRNLNLKNINLKRRSNANARSSPTQGALEVGEDHRVLWMQELAEVDRVQTHRPPSLGGFWIRRALFTGQICL